MHFFRSKKNTEDKIKEATFELLANKGYANVSMRDIAKKAQTALGQLTYYYGTKEHLIVSVIDEIINEFLTELEEYINKATDKINAITTFFDELFEKEDKVFRVLIDFTAQSMWNDTFNEKVRKFLLRVSELITNTYKEEGLDEEAIQSQTKMLMAIISGKAVQKVFNYNYANNRNDIIIEKERKLFNAKPANGLL